MTPYSVLMGIIRTANVFNFYFDNIKCTHSFSVVLGYSGLRTLYLDLKVTKISGFLLEMS